MKKITLLALVAALGCGSDSETGTSVSLSFNGLPQLGADFVYEGWFIVDGAPVTTGRFDVAADGSFDSNFDVGAEAPSTFVLTIEPRVGDDPAPSDTHVVAGDFGADGIANLTIGHPAALSDDFTAAAGEFILATPTNGNETPTQGIWFLDPSDETATLALPTLPAGWAYEGWIVGADGPVSTGTFTDVAAADSDAAGPTAGPMGAPPFPGQDFIAPPVDLSTGHMAVISIEPSPDDSPAPFQLKPLAGPIGTDTAPTLQSLNNVLTENTIGGTAVLN
ncbi:MAG: anti-sigma factor [Myxococcota bacterium]